MRVMGKVNTPSSKSGTPMPPVNFDFLKVHIPPPPDSTSAATTADKPPTPPPPPSDDSTKGEPDDGYNLRDSRKKRSELDYNLQEAPAKKMKSSSSSAKKSGKVSFWTKEESIMDYLASKEASSLSGTPSSLPPTKITSALFDGPRKHQEEPTQLYEGKLITEFLDDDGDDEDDDFEESTERTLQDVLHIDDDFNEYFE